MSFVVDTDICSAFVRGDRLVSARFLQYTGSLSVSAITMGELLVWALRAKAPPQRLSDVFHLLQHASLLEVTLDVARVYGDVQAHLMDTGMRAPQMDMMIAATALLHGFTLVTHNSRHYANVPGLAMTDWLIP